MSQSQLFVPPRTIKQLLLGVQIFFDGSGLITYNLTGLPGFDSFPDADSYVVHANYIADSFNAANAGIIYVEYIDGLNFKIHSTNPADGNGVRFVVYPLPV